MRKQAVVHAATLLLGCAFLGPFITPAAAQSPGAWAPTKPMRLITPFAAAGSVDLVARTVASHFAAELGQPVVVDNRPGANGVVAIPQAARADPDGHTLAFVTTSIVAVNPALYKNLPYDTLRDFAPIGTVCEVQMVLVANAGFAPNTLPELVALAKSKPDAISYASSGVGVFGHLVAEMLKSRAGIRMVHIPYKGEAPGLQELMAGRVQVAFFTYGTSRAMIEAGTLKALAVPSAQRMAELPNVATISEQGVPDFEPSLWYGIAAPKATPPEAIARMSRALQSLLAKPETRQLFQRQALTPLPATPEQTASRIAADIRRYGEIVRAANITVD